MQQNVRFFYFAERRTEGRNQLCRKFADKTDGIGEQHAHVLAEIHFAGERIERGEQAILDVDVLRASHPLQD